MFRGVKKFLGGRKIFRGGKKILRGIIEEKMGNELKERSSKNFCLYIQNRDDDIQKWVNLSSFWKILALGP